MNLRHIGAALLALCSAGASAQTYNLDPSHTFPSFEADHYGISTFRGKFNKTSGKVVLDRAAKTGTLEVVIDATSLDFGHAKMNEIIKGKNYFDVEQFPTITYVGRSIRFEGDQPVAVDGEMTLLGVTRPLALTINKFKCIQHPLHKREVCGADVNGSFNRIDYGMKTNSPPHHPEIKLFVQVEGVRAE